MHELIIKMVVDPRFWFSVLALGAILLFIGKKKQLLDNTAFAVVVSVLIAVAYFHIVDHYLMDMQGLDYWYGFRK